MPVCWGKVSFLVLVWLLVWASSRLANAQAEAVVGVPFGVAQITVSVPRRDAGLPTGRTTLTLEGPPGRVLYPAVSEGVLRRLLGRGAPPRSKMTVLFLFRGESPFDLTVGTPTPQKFTVTPESRSAVAHGRMLRRWWQCHNGLFREMAGETAYPPLVETYLTSMLARRLNLDAPLLERLRVEADKSEGRQTLELLSGAQAMRMEILKAVSLGTLPPAEDTDRPLPQPVAWRPTNLPRLEEEVAIEPMAMRVPEECFYVRFGLYANFLWLSALIEDYGGDIGNMLSARGYRNEINQRVQNQLVLEQGVLAELLGPQAIADMALIGLDTFTREGAALGALFEARGSLLGVDLVRQRQEALFREKDNGATLTTIQVAGRDVSLLATPDNRLRSYYLVDGNYHLVTNSRAIVERFLAVADGPGSLGENSEFRYARSVVPTSREDTIFVYFSSAFLRNLLSPQYQIELQRRMRAVADLELVTLARLAAVAENVPGKTVQDLVTADLLPPDFAARPDGSAPVLTDTRTFDSLRGARGYFTPVPDVAIEHVSRAEYDRYTRQASYYAENWKQVDPLLVAVKRYRLNGTGGERITVDAFITPMNDFKYQVLMSSLGEPSKYRLEPPNANLISIEAALRGGILFPAVPPHRLFLGVQDHVPLGEYLQNDVLKWLQLIRNTPGYLGAWPKLGFLDLLPLGRSPPSDEESFSQLPLGLLRWQGRGFSVLSRDQGILTQASQQLGFVEEEDAAQIRVHVGDLSASKFGGWLNAMGYERARQVSLANVRFLGVFTQQLHVPRADAKHVAENVLDAHLVCALGGEYQLKPYGETRLWCSTLWPTTRDYPVPEDYVTPPLDWFRGLEARLVKYPDRLVIHGHIDMQRKDRAPAIRLPFFGTPSNKQQSAEPAERDFR